MPHDRVYLKHIETQEEIGTVFRRITADVYANTQKQQLPELSLSLIGEFHLKGASAAAVSNADDVDALQKKMKQLEDQLKQRAKSGTSADAHVVPVRAE